MTLLEKIKSNLLANDPVDKHDKEIFTSKDKSTIERSEKFANFMGRRILIGNLVGAARVIYGLAKATLCLTAHSLVFLTGLTIATLLPAHTKQYVPIFQFGTKIGAQTADGILHVARGIVEMLPLIGIPILTKWDESQLAAHFNS